jgi:hypothetical protein
MLCVAGSGARAQGGQMPLQRCARGPTGARGAGDRTMLVEQLAESTPPREQLGGSAGGSCPPGGRRDAVPRVIPAVSCSPRRHTRRLSPSRSSTALSCSGCLASIKPHRRAFPSHRKWSSRRLPQPALRGADRPSRERETINVLHRSPPRHPISPICPLAVAAAIPRRRTTSSTAQTQGAPAFLRPITAPPALPSSLTPST